MCGPAVIPIAAAIVGAVVAAKMAPDAPEMPKPPDPQKPPQVSKGPDAGAIRRQNTGGTAAGMTGASSGTMLTGPAGVALGSAQLGRNTLLGGAAPGPGG